MKKLILTLAFMLIAFQYSNAQISYGIKAGLNFASPSDVVASDGSTPPIDANTSYHVGGFLRVKVPVLGLYVRPEVVYTSITTSLPIPNELGGTVPSDFKLNRIDIPVLIGLKMFGVANAFAGPVFQNVITSDLDATGISELDSEDFSVGMQLGVGFEFWKLGLDVRYETAFSDNVSEFEVPDDSEVLNYQLDNSPDQFILGLSYKF